jgi:transcriptional regulator with XRE-family HTH domain
MKPKEQKEACRLRQEEGLSVKDIARQLKVSPSSVSLWVRDIALTDSQVIALEEKRKLAFAQAQKKGALIKSESARYLRQSYQDEGRLKAEQKEWLHAAGCMLYWGEGSKGKNQVSLSNSHPPMLVFFKRFLQECYGVKTSELTFNCHIFPHHDGKKTEAFWLKTLSLPNTCLRKTVIYKPRGEGKRGETMPYGVGNLGIGNTKIVQGIFGAIQHYAQFEEKNWLK